jgi:hypothetical protein
MLLARIFRLGVTAGVLAAAVVAASAQQVSAAHHGFVPTIRYDSGAPKGYDHIICYNVTPANSFPGANVYLFDQFYPSAFEAMLSQTTTACTPAKKTLLYRKPNAVKPNGHFVCYPINQPPTIKATRSYVNQLEKNSATFMTPGVLCVPTDKEDASPPPTPHNHLLVYDGKLQGAEFEKALPKTTVTLYDQFFPSGFTTTLGSPVALLTPARKELINQKPIPVKPNGHWIQYAFRSPAAVSETRNYINQLEKNTVNVFFPSFLLVPTNKSL